MGQKCGFVKTIYDKIAAIRLDRLGNEWERYYLFDKDKATIVTSSLIFLP